MSATHKVKVAGTMQPISLYTLYMLQNLHKCSPIHGEADAISHTSMLHTCIVSRMQGTRENERIFPPGVGQRLKTLGIPATTSHSSLLSLRQQNKRLCESNRS